MIACRMALSEQYQPSDIGAPSMNAVLKSLRNIHVHVTTCLNVCTLCLLSDDIEWFER